MTYLFFLAGVVLLVCLLDRLWLRHVARSLDADAVDRKPLFDPDGTLELTARMTELCHGRRDEVDRLLAQQRQWHAQASHAELVQLAMQHMLAPQGGHPSGMPPVATPLT